jgi:hypothetical protein
VLAGQVKRLAARDQERQVGAGSEQRRQLRGGGGQVFEVVEQEEQPHVPDVLGELAAGADGAGRGLHHELRVAERGERDPPDAVGEVISRLGRGLQRQPRLAGPAGTGERDKADVVAAEERREHLELRRAAQEGRGRHRQVRLVQCLERRMLTVVGLEDALWCGQVLEPMRAEVLQAGIGQERGRRGADQHLAAVAGSGDAGALVDVGTDVSLVRQQRCAGVQADANANRAGGERVGGGVGGCQGAGGGGKGHEKGVALGVDLDPAVG